MSSKSHPFVCSRGCIPQALNWEFSFIKDFGLPSGKGPNFSSKSIHSFPLCAWENAIIISVRLISFGILMKSHPSQGS